MFNKATIKSNGSTESTSVNLIGAGTTIEGDVTTSGDIRIDGSLKGSIKVQGKLVLGTSGNVDGEVICQNADISGSLSGKIEVSELLSLKASAKITGDIFTNKIAIDPGASFSGSCSMGGVIKDIKGDQSKKQEVAEKIA